MAKTDFTRSGGVLLPIFSLPNPYGIGTFGGSAYRFVDFLKKAGQKYWQILPLVPTGYGDSPYQSFSSVAGNPYFIDPELLEKEGLLVPEDYQAVDFGQNPDAVDYGKLYENRLAVLRKAYENGQARLRKELAAFTAEQESWLPDYALFMALKSHFAMLPLSQWPDGDIRSRKAGAMARYQSLLAEEIDFHIFLQYLFFRQWLSLKAYANENGIRIIGDIPIYVSEDSAEFWSRRTLFQCRRDGTPQLRAGVPPDLYSQTGQLWGNPLYNWRRMELDGFSWWVWRIRQTSQFYDVIRIDHFRGLESYWAVPAGEETAMNGRWIKGPGMKLITAIQKGAPNAVIIAEDLGDIDDAVRAFLAESGFPGMKLLINAFDPEGESAYLPHNIEPYSIAYTSSHDSPTFIDFLLAKATPEEKAFAMDYLRLNTAEGYNWGAVKAIWSSPAVLAIAPFADILGLGADARINIPATLGGNWQWRVREDAFNDEVASMLAHITRTYRR